MAIEVEILKDIQGYKPKMLGPLTARNLACIGIGAAVAFLVKTVLVIGTNVVLSAANIKGAVNEPIAWGIGFLFAIPFIIAGFISPYGLPAEKFISQIWKTKIAAPSVRPYKTKNSYEMLFSSIDVPTSNFTLTKEEIKERKKADKKLKKDEAMIK